MDDFEQFEKLLEGGYCCISIVTYEERYALEIVRQTALNLNRDMWIWYVAGGVRDGLLADGPVIKDTDRPEAGLSNLNLCHL